MHFINNNEETSGLASSTTKWVVTLNFSITYEHNKSTAVKL